MHAGSVWDRLVYTLTVVFISCDVVGAVIVARVRCARIAVVAFVGKIDAFPCRWITEIQGAEVVVITLEQDLRCIETRPGFGLTFTDCAWVPVVTLIRGIGAVTCFRVTVVKRTDIVVDAGVRLVVERAEMSATLVRLAEVVGAFISIVTGVLAVCAVPFDTLIDGAEVVVGARFRRVDAGLGRVCCVAVTYGAQVVVVTKDGVVRTITEVGIAFVRCARVTIITLLFDIQAGSGFIYA